MTDIHVDVQGNLWVVDANHRRVLRFANASNISIATPVADQVIGQADLSSGSATNPPTASTLLLPNGVFCDNNGRLWVADASNHRVLWYDNASTRGNGPSADGAIGQGSFSSKTSGTGLNELSSPFGVHIDASGRLWVADAGNNRVLRFDNPTNQQFNDTANGRLGGNGEGSALNQMHFPTGLSSDGGGRLWVADFFNHRILYFNDASSKADGTVADGQLGTGNAGSGTNQFNLPVKIFVNGSNLWVADASNNRAVRFNINDLEEGLGRVIAETGAVRSTGASFNVQPAPLSTFTVDGNTVGAEIGTIAAGQVTTVTVRALDQFNNLVTGFTNTTATLTSTTAQINSGTVLSPTFAAGSASVEVSVTNAGVHTLTVSTTANDAIGTSASFTVTPAPIVGFVVEVTTEANVVTTTTAGAVLDVKISALDQFGNTTATGYAFTTVSVTSNSFGGTLTSPLLVNGTTTMTVTATLAGISLDANDRAIFVSGDDFRGTSATFSVNPAPIASFSVRANEAGDDIAIQKVATPFNVFIRALDQFGNNALSFNNTTATVVSNALNTNTVVTFNDGTGTTTLSFTAQVSGLNRTITISTTANSATGQSNAFDVEPGAVASYQFRSVTPNALLTGSSPFTAGSQTNTILRALDAFNNTVTTTGTVTVVSTAFGGATTTATFTGGFDSQQFIFRPTASGTHTAAVQVSPGVNIGTTASFTVNPGPLHNFAISVSNADGSPFVANSTTAGQEVRITVRARDEFNNFRPTDNSAVNVTSNTFFPGVSGNLTAGIFTQDVLVTRAQQTLLDEPATNAVLVLGANDFETVGTWGTNANIRPIGVAVDPTTGKVFVAVAQHNAEESRIFRFAKIEDLTNGAAPEIVLFSHGTGSNQLRFNTSFVFDVSMHIDNNGNLWVPDRMNHRVLRFDNASALDNSSTASVVVGQVDFTSLSSGVSRSKFSEPSAVFVDAGDRLWVADRVNNRVLRFDNASVLPATGATASVVLGQNDFESNAAGAGANQMSHPISVYVTSDDKLWVADLNSNRVLRFDNVSTLTDGASATIVLGQPGFGSTDDGSGLNQMRSPRSVAVDPVGRLWVADGGLARRILRFDESSSISQNGVGASGVLGAGTGLTQSEAFPSSIAVSDNRLWVVANDITHRRVLAFDIGGAIINDRATVTATAGAVVSTGASFNVLPAPLSTFTVDGNAVGAPIGEIVAGEVTTVTIRARDQFNNVVTGFTNTTATLSSTTAQLTTASVTAPIFTLGAASVQISVTNAGVHTLIVSTTANDAIGTSATFVVTAANVVAYLVEGTEANIAIGQLISGVPTTITVTAQDIFGNTNNNYTATTALVSSTAFAGNTVATFTNGIGTAVVTPTLAGEHTITVSTDANARIGTSATFVVTSGNVSTFTVVYSTDNTISLTNSTIIAGTTSVTITARDQFGNPVLEYEGPISITSNSFTTGSVVVTVSNFVNGTAADVEIPTHLVGTNRNLTISTNALADVVFTPFTVVHAPLAQFAFQNNVSPFQTLGDGFPVGAVAGSAINIRLVAQDQFGNTVVSYNGAGNNAQLSSTNANLATALATTSDFNSGIRTGVSFTPRRAGNDITITVTGAGVTSTSGVFTVNAAPFVNIVAVSTGNVPLTEANIVAGQPFTVNITAVDQFGNEDLSLNGQTAAISSTNGNLTSPANGITNQFVGGTITGQELVLTIAGEGRTLTLTKDAVVATTAGFTVLPSELVGFTVTGANGVNLGTLVTTAGVPTLLEVAARDQFNNIKTDFTGLVTITSATGQLFDGDENVAAVTSATPINGVTTLSVAITNVGEHTLNFTNGTISSSAIITVTNADATRIAFLEGTTQTILSGATAASMSFGFFDQFGNEATTTSGVRVVLTSGATVIAREVALTDANPVIVSFVDVPVNTTGIYSVTANTIAGDLIETSGTLTVNSSPAVSITLDNNAQLVTTAGFTSPSIAVRIRDQFGNEAATTSVIRLSLTVGAQNIVLNQAYANPTVFDFAGIPLNTTGTFTYVVSDVDGTLTTTTNTILVNPAEAVRIAIVQGTEQTITAGTIPSNVLVELFDQFDNRSATGGNVTLSYTLGDNVLRFVQSQASNDTTHFDFEFTQPVATSGTWALAVTGANMTTSTGTLEVTAANATTIVFVENTTQTIATATQPLNSVVAVRDQFNNAASTGGTLTVTLTNGANSIVITTTQTTALANIPVEYPVIATVGTWSIAVSGDNMTTTNGSIDVTLGPPTQLLVEGIQAGVTIGTQTAGVATTITITAADNGGNVAPSFSVKRLLAIEVSSANTAFAVTPTLAVQPVGSGTATNAATDGASPYAGHFFGARVQYLIRGAELTAAGIRAGDVLSSLAFYVENKNSVPAEFTNYRIAMGNTATASLTNFEAGLTEVSAPKTIITDNVAMPNEDWYVHVFDNNFTYNGDNIVVEICFTNPAQTANGSISVRQSPITGYTSQLIRTSASSAGNATVCTGTPTSNNTNRPNILFGKEGTLPGRVQFVVTPTTAGDAITINATSATGNISGESAGFAVKAAAPHALRVTGANAEPMLATTTAGLAYDIQVQAVDIYGNVAPTYSGAAVITSTNATLTGEPIATENFEAGVTSLSLIIETAFPEVRLNAATTGLVSITSAAVNVESAGAVSFTIASVNGAAFGGSLTTTAGLNGDYVLHALDQFGNIATGFTTEATITSATAIFSQDNGATTTSTITTADFVGGTRALVLAITNVNAGHSLVITTNTLRSTINNIAVEPAGVDSYQIRTVTPDALLASQSPFTAGVSTSAVLRAIDAFGNSVVTTTTLTVVSSALGGGTTTATFTGGFDSQSFGFRPTVSGNHTAAVEVSPGVNIATTAIFTVNPGPLHNFAISVSNANGSPLVENRATAGQMVRLTIRARDEFNNFRPTDNSTVIVTSNTFFPSVSGDLVAGIFTQDVQVTRASNNVEVGDPEQDHIQSIIPQNADYPSAVAVDPNTGKVFIANNSTPPTIQRYDSEGNFEIAFDNGVGLGLSRALNDIHIDIEGNLWVADADNHRVLRFANASNITITNPIADQVIGQADLDSVGSSVSITASSLNRPFGVFCEDNGRLWIADQQNNRVLWYNNAATRGNQPTADGVIGQANDSSSTQGDALNQLWLPSAVYIDFENRLWVADRANHRVLRFDNPTAEQFNASADGRLGGNGSGDAMNQMHSPIGVASDRGGRLWVSDPNNHRILYFDNAAYKPDGASAEGQIGTGTEGAGTNEFEYPDKIAVNGSNLWVADGSNNRIVRFNINVTGTGLGTVTAESGAIRSTSGNFIVVPGQLNTFSVDGNEIGVEIGTIEAGEVTTVTIRALDQFNNVVTGFTKTSALIGSTTAQITSASVTAPVFTLGVTSVQISVTNAGVHTLVVSTTANGGVEGTSATFVVTAANVVAFLVEGTEANIAIGNLIAGVSTTITITATDQFGNTNNNYSAVTALVTSSSFSGSTIATFVSGISTVEVLPTISGSHTITVATDANTRIGTSATFTVGSGNIVRYAAFMATDATVSVTTVTFTAGDATSVTIRALDANDNTVITLTNDVVVTSASFVGELRGTLEQGATTLTITPTVSGMATLTVSTSANITTVVTPFDVVPGALANFEITQADNSTLVGFTVTTDDEFDIRIRARDANNNYITTLTTTVTVSSTNSNIFIGTTANLAAGEVNNHTVRLSVVTTAGITVSLNGVSSTVNGIIVNPGEPVAFSIVPAAGTKTAGIPFAVTITALDQANNTAPGYNGTVSITSNSDLVGTPVVTPNFTNGVLMGQMVTLIQAGTQATLTVTKPFGDPATSVSAPFTIEPATLATFTLLSDSPITTIAGVPFTVQVQARDMYNNIKTNLSSAATVDAETGQFAFTGSTVGTSFVSVPFEEGVMTTMPSIVNVGTYTITISTSGVQTVATVTVLPASAAVLTRENNEEQTIIAGTTAASVNVAVRDEFGNLQVTTETLTVTLSTGANIVRFPVDLVSVSEATVSFAGYALNTAGTWAVEYTSASLTTTTSTVTVLPAAAFAAFGTEMEQDIVAGTTVAAISVEVRDEFGNLSATTQTLTIRLTTATAEVAFTQELANASEATVSFEGYPLNTTGTWELSITSATFAATTGTIEVMPAPVAAISFEANTTQTITAGTVLADVGIATRDIFGNLSVSTGTIEVKFVNAAAEVVVTQNITSASEATISLAAVQLNTTGTWSATVTSAGLTSTSGSILVTPATPVAYTFEENTTQTITAGTTAAAISVAIRDEFGNLSASTTTIEVSLVSGAAEILVTSSIISASQATISFDNVPLNTTGVWSMTVTSPTLTSTAGTITVEAAVPTQVVLEENTSQTIIAGSTAAAISVSIRDEFGNLSASTGTLEARFVNGAVEVVVNKALTGVSEANVTFVDAPLNTTGTWSVTLTSASLTSTEATVIVLPAVATALTVELNTTQTIVAGTTAAAVNIAVRDEFGNLQVTTETVSVRLTTGANVVAFETDLVNSSEATVLFGGYNLNTSGTWSVEYTSATLSTTTSTVEVIAAPAVAIFGTDMQQTTIAGSTAAEISVVVRDEFGNLSTTTETLTIRLTTATAEVAFTQELVNVSEATVSFEGYPLNTTGTWALSITTSTLAATTGSINVLPAVPTAIEFVSNTTQTILAGEIPASIAIRVVDEKGNLTASTGTFTVTLTTGANAVVVTTTLTASSEATISFVQALNTTGTWAVEVTSPTLTATTGSVAVNVTSGSLAALDIRLATNNSVTIADVTAGDVVEVTITARDQFSNVIEEFAGQVEITSGTLSGIVTTPTFTNGTSGTIALSFDAVGTHTLTARTTAANVPFVTNTTNTFTVGGGAHTGFAFTGAITPTIGDQVAGESFVVTVTAVDAGGNAIPSYPIASFATVQVTSATTPNLTYSLRIVTTGTGEASNADNSPFTPYATQIRSVRSQYLIRQSELAASGITSGMMLNRVSFEVTNLNGAGSVNNFRLALTNTALTNLNGSAFQTVTTVFGPATVTPTLGWNTHQFDTPFEYTGGNIIVEVCHDQGASVLGVNSISTRFTQVTEYTPTRFVQSNNAGVCANNATVNSAFRPNMLFGLEGVGLASTQYNVTITEATVHTLTATAQDGITGTSDNFNVGPAPMVAFEVLSSTGAAITAQEAGVPFAIRVRGLDQFNNVANYSGNVNITSTNATIVATSGTFVNNETTLSVTVQSTGADIRLTADNGTIFGTSNSFQVNPNAFIASFRITTEGGSSDLDTTTAGMNFTLKITAFDEFNNVKTDFVSTATVTSNTANIVKNTTVFMPGEEITVGPFVQGAATITVSVTNAVIGGTVHDIVVSTNGGAITSTNTITVVPAPVHNFIIGTVASTTVADAQAGVAFAVEMTARDEFDNTTASIENADLTAGQATLSSPLGIIAESNNRVVVVFNASGVATTTITVTSAGVSRTLQVTTPTVTATSNEFIVTNNTIAGFRFNNGNAITSQAVNEAFNIPLAAIDAWQNVVTNFNDEVTVTSNSVVEPSTVTLTNGQGTITTTPTVSLPEAQLFAEFGAIRGTSATFVVSSASVSYFAIEVNTTGVVAGQAFSMTITAKDDFDNTVTPFNKEVRITSATAGIVGNVAIGTAVNGVTTITLTVTTAGVNQTFTVTGNSVTTPTVLITSVTTLNVAPAALHTFAISDNDPGTIVGTQVANQQFTLFMSARDEFGNLITDYAQPVSVTSNVFTGALNDNFSAGLAQVSVTPITATTEAQITVESGILSIKSNMFAVLPGALAKYEILSNGAAIGTQTVAVSTTVTIRALDAVDNLIGTYNETVRVTSNAVAGAEVGYFALANGVTTITLTPNVAGVADRALTVSTTAGSGVTSTSNLFTVISGQAVAFTVTNVDDTPLSGTFVAGIDIPVKVTARDEFGNQVIAFNETIELVGTTSAVVAATSSATLVAGATTHNVQLTRATSATAITARTTDASVSGTSAIISVVANDAVGYAVTVTTADKIAGELFEITIEAVDMFGNRDFNASFFQADISSNFGDISDGVTTAATLQSDFLQDGIVKMNIKTNLAGTTATITATGFGDPATSAQFTVLPAAIEYFTVRSTSGQMLSTSAQIAGVPFNVRLTAFDRFDNLKTNYSSTATVTSANNDLLTPVVADNFAEGVATVSVTLTTASVSAELFASTTGVLSTSGVFTVIPNNTAGSFVINTIVTPQFVGTSTTAEVTVRDAFGNVIAGYSGTAIATSASFVGEVPVVFSSSATTTFAFTPTIQTTEATVIVSTGATARGTSNIFEVQAGFATATTSTLSTVAVEVLVGNSTTLTITLRDQFGNTTASAGVIEVLATTSGTGNATISSISTTGHLRTFTYTAGTTAYVQATAEVRIGGETVGTITVTQAPATAATTSVLAFTPTLEVGLTTTLTLTMFDVFGNTTANMSGVEVTLPTLNVTGEGATNSAFTIESNVATFTYTAGTTAHITVPVTISLADGHVTANIVQVPLEAHFATSTMVVEPTVIEVGGNSTASVTLTLRDLYGNTTASVNNLTLSLISSPATTAVQVGEYVGTTHIRTALITSGTVAGVFNVETRINSSQVNSIAITQVAATTAQFVVTDINGVSITSNTAQPIIVGTAYQVVITARDQFGNTTASFNSDIEITSATAQITAASLTVGDFVNGSTTVTLTFNEVGTHDVVVSSATPSVISTIAGVLVNPEGTEVTVSMRLEGLYDTSANVHKPTAVAVELRQGPQINTSALVRVEAGVLNTSGTVTVRYSGLANAGPYWVVIRHTGHLPVASSSATTLNLGANNTFDFRQTANVFEGEFDLTNLGGGIFALRAGDVDGNQIINPGDFTKILSNNGAGIEGVSDVIGYIEPVLTGALTTVSFDKLYLEGYYNTTANVHTPAPVMIELRTGTTAETSVLAALSAGVISTAGTVSAPFGNLAAGNYWVVVRAGAHNAVISATATTFDIGGNNTFNFSNAANVFEGADVMVEVLPGVFALRAGDVNADGIIQSAVDGAILVAPGNQGTGTEIPAATDPGI